MVDEYGIIAIISVFREMGSDNYEWSHAINNIKYKKQMCLDSRLVQRILDNTFDKRNFNWRDYVINTLKIPGNKLYQYCLPFEFLTVSFVPQKSQIYINFDDWGERVDIINNTFTV